MTRKLLSENVFLYKLYFHLYRKHRGIRPNWFKSKTKIYYDGYPRSGNTFLHHLFRNIFPDIHTVHHHHKIAPVKISLYKNIPSFILIRNPEDCIPSNYLKHFSMINGGGLPDSLDQKLLHRMTEDYVNYYYYVKRNHQNVNLISFDTLITSPGVIIQQIAKSLNMEEDQKIIDSKITKAQQTYSGATDKLGSSKPLDYKEKRKTEIRDVLMGSNKFEEAKRIYKNLLNK